eukprot:5468388-Pleurochrysis_carterae.AAC.12
MVKRFVGECGITLEAAATANLLILAMHVRTSPGDDLLINSSFVAQALPRRTRHAMARWRRR